MKKIGIIFALKEELDATKKIFNNSIKHHIYDLKIYECNYQTIKCFLVESGMGKVNAARSTQILIDNMEVDYILNIGVAGSISKDINKCDIVIANKLCQHDFDITSLGFEKGLIPNAGKYIDCDNKLFNIAKTISMGTNVKMGIISSGDIFISDEKMGSKINQKYNAICVEMEGAAVAQVCFLCKKPFLVIRAISDSPYEKDNNITYEEFLTISSDTVSKFVKQFIEKIT